MPRFSSKDLGVEFVEIVRLGTGLRAPEQANVRARISTEINGTGNLWCRDYLFEIDNP